MTSKRKLKKEINDICLVLFAECIAKMLCCDEKRQEDIDAVADSIMSTCDNYTRRISHPEPGMKKKDYFKDLIDSFNKDVDEIIDHITSIN